MGILRGRGGKRGENRASYREMLLVIVAFLYEDIFECLNKPL